MVRKSLVLVKSNSGKEELRENLRENKPGMEIKFNKTGHMVVGGKGECLQINHKVVRTVQELKCLVFIIDKHDTVEKDINNRIIIYTLRYLTIQAIESLNGIIWNRIYLETKVNIIRTTTLASNLTFRGGNF